MSWASRRIWRRWSKILKGFNLSKASMAGVVIGQCGRMRLAPKDRGDQTCCDHNRDMSWLSLLGVMLCSIFTFPCGSVDI